MVRRRRSLLSVVVRLLAVVLVVFLAVVAVSVVRVSGEIDKATKAYERYDACFQENDYSGAVLAVHDMADCADAIEHEVNSWCWEVVKRLPIIGEDVVCAQELASVTDALANDALMPALAPIEGLSAGDGSDVLSTISDNMDRLGEFATALINARSVVADCRMRVEAIPTSHFAGLNDLVSKVREVTVEVDDAFGILDSLVGAASSLGLAVGGE